MNEEKLINCNCNDCIYMVRSFNKRQEHINLHYREQKKSFDTKRAKLLKKIDENLLKVERGTMSKKDCKRKNKATMNMVNSMEFVFDGGKTSLHYGRCILNGTSKDEIKEVSFIPNILQLHTQDCFKSR